MNSSYREVVKLEFDHNKVPPTQGEIDAFLKAANERFDRLGRLKYGWLVGAAILVFTIIAANAALLYFTIPSLGEIIAVTLFLSGIGGMIGVFYCFMRVNGVSHERFELRWQLDAYNPATTERLQELSELVTETGISPRYLAHLNTQVRRPTEAEVSMLIYDLREKRNLAKKHTDLNEAMQTLGLTNVVEALTRTGNAGDQADTGKQAQ